MLEADSVIKESITIPVPRAEAWAAVATAEGLAPWYGTFTGDVASGEVELTVNEAPDQPGTVQIRNCIPSASYTARLPYDDWVITVSLIDAGETTTVTVYQDRFTGDYADVAAGWQYHLRRLSAQLTGTDPDDVEWETVRAEYP